MYLVVELSDVLLDVRQQAPEGELLDELSDVAVVIKGQTRPVAPCSPPLRSGFLQLCVSRTEGGQAPRAARCVQLQRVALQAAGCSVCIKRRRHRSF